jgi:hypothetical protein
MYDLSCLFNFDFLHLVTFEWFYDPSAEVFNQQKKFSQMEVADLLITLFK